MRSVIILECLIGICAGGFTAAGLFAVINSIGIINRIADVSKTRKCLVYYEDVVIIGASIGNIMWIFDIRVPLGMIGVILYGMLSGMYIGLFLVCLAEMINSLPIFIRKVRIGTGLGFIILAIAFGKTVGQLLYYFKMY